MEKIQFCPDHGNVIHHVFLNGLSACLDCVESVVEAERKNAALIAAQVKNSISKNECEELLVSAQKAKAALRTEDEDIGILGLIACKTVREHSTVKDVLHRIRTSSSFYA